MKPILFIALPLLMLCSPKSGAAENLSSTVEKVIAQNPVLRGARAQIDSAESGYHEIRNQRYPRLAVRSSYIHGNNPVYVFGSLLEQQSFGPRNFAIDSLNNPDYLTNIKNSLDVGVPLFMAFEIADGEKIQRLNVAQAQEQFGLTDQNVRYQATEAYLFVLLKQETLNALNARIESATKEIDDARKLNAKGLVLGSDFYAAQAILSSLTAQQIRSQQELAAAKRRLAIMMGEPSLQPSVTGSLLTGTYSLGDEEGLVTKALSARRDVKEADLNVAKADVGVELAGRSFLPKIEAFASLETNTEDFESNPTNQTVGVRSNFPIGDPAYFSRKSKAKADARATRSEKDRVEESIRIQVMDALGRYRGANESLPLIQQAVQQAAKSLELFRPLYREGRQSILDVLRAEEGLSQAQAALYANRYEIHAGYARVLLATGRFDAAAVQEIEKNLEAHP